MRAYRSNGQLRYRFRPRFLELECRVVPSFLSARAFDAGFAPQAAVMGDFNGDGIPDLAVANNIGEGTVSVLLGNGDGSFKPPRSFATGDPGHPDSLAVGDFNGDGILDLAVTNGPSAAPLGSVSVLLGNGDGSFQPAHTFAVGLRPLSVAVGDFNGDGVLDLAVANFDAYGSGPGSVSVLLGNGDGSFQPAHSFDAGRNPASVAIGDFNGDGNLDLAVAEFGSDAVGVLLGRGDGTFQPAQSFAAGSNPISVAVGDVNGDGLLDVAVADYGSNTVSVLLGTGDGSFQPAQSFDAGTNPDSVVMADFNGDGVPDLAVANPGTSPEDPVSSVNVLLGNGDGSFQPAQSFDAGGDPRSVAMGDFNGDGIPDLAVADSGTGVGANGVVSVLLGTGDGSFPEAQNVSAGTEPQAVAIGDFNGDGIPDLAVADLSGGVSVLLGNGDGSFQPAHSFDAGFFPDAVVVGDFNGDGIPDLAVLNRVSNDVSVLLGNGDGSFQPALDFPTMGMMPQSVAIGDFNGDGILDLAVANSGSRLDNGSVSVLLGNGDGSFQPAQSFAAGSHPASVAVGDFNGDGILDLITTGSVLLGNGDGSFQPARSVNTGPAQAVAVGDFNGDGILDLVAVGNAGGAGSVSVALGNGDGTFQLPRSFATGGVPVAVVVGDVNGDGIPDLAVVDTVGVRVLLGNGDGSFQSSNFSYVAGSRPVSVAVGDVNGDGWPDLVTANFYSNDVSLLFNDGTWTGPHRGSGGGTPRGGRFSSRGAGGPSRSAVRHPAAVAEAQLAGAAFPNLRSPALAGAVAEPAPAPPPRDSARTASVATPNPAPRWGEFPPPTHARPVALPVPQSILDLPFGDALAAGSDASLLGDRGTLSARHGQRPPVP